MKVVHFSDCYFPAVNGVSSSIYTLRNELIKRDLRVLLVIPRYDKTEEDSESIIALSSVPIPGLPDNRFGLPWPWRAFTRIYEFAPDVIHIHTPGTIGFLGLIWAKLHGIPYCFTNHSLFDEYLTYFPFPDKITKWIIIKWLNLFWQNARMVISPSNEVAKRMRAQGCTRETYIIPTAIDERLFINGDKEFVCRELKLERRPLLYVGRIAYEKSLDFLLKVLHYLQSKSYDLPFVLIGDGPAKLDLQKQAEKLGVRAYFLGWRKREELKDYYASAEAFIFASQTETQGLVVAEAEIAGLPVIAIKASGVTEAVPFENNLLIDSVNIEKFAQKILDILENRSLIGDLIDHAKEHIRVNFSIAGVTDKVISLYKTLKKG